jgi:DNA polymerase-3 subunit gamma/tau
LNIYELDAASNNSVDDIRGLIEQVRIAPQLGDFKVYIIDEVHMLSASAFNAFLKTLEEPPAHAIFILATTEKHKIIPTILSRCQIFDFSRIRVSDIALHLEEIAQKESVTFEKEGLHLIAAKADGALRDALSIFDQIVTFSNGNITYQQVLTNLHVLDYDYYFKIVDYLKKEDIPGALLLLNDILEKGFDGHQFLLGLSEHFRDLMMVKDIRTAPLLENTEQVRQKFIQQANEWEKAAIVRALHTLSKADVQFKSSKNQRLLIEVTLMELASLHQESEKKKSLTDPIDILPFQGQTRISTQENSHHVPKMVKEEAPKYVPPTPAIKQEQRISIKQSIEKEQEIKVIPEDQLPRTPLSADTLRVASRKYAVSMKENGKETFYHAMVKRDFTFQDEKITWILDNEVQKSYITPMLVEFMTFLKHEVKNGFLTIELEVSQTTEKENKPYTGKDKFLALARKNPNLHTLKNLFNLDIEF